MPGSSSNRDVWLVTKELTAETGFDRVMVEGKEPKKYVVYYRIDGKPQGLTKRWFVIESLVGFLIIASTFVLYKFTLALIVLCFVTPCWLLWWGIGRYNANKLERGSR